MKVLLYVAAVLLSVPILLLAAVYGASELGGEVVVLQRANEDGSHSNVRVWIVEKGETAWIEHGEADAHWIRAMEATQTVQIQRDGLSTTFSAQADPEAHGLYHELRRQKYGWAEDFLAALGGGEENCSGIPVRVMHP